MIRTVGSLSTYVAVSLRESGFVPSDTGIDDFDDWLRYTPDADRVMVRVVEPFDGMLDLLTGKYRVMFTHEAGYCPCQPDPSGEEQCRSACPDTPKVPMVEGA